MSAMKTISEKTYLELKATARRVKELEADAKKLAALEAGGVDNWEGYDESMERGGLYDDDEPTTEETK
jgi:hypothetical protein